MSVPVGSAFLIEPVPDEIFTPEDFTEDQRAMARTAEEFVDREVIPRIAEIEEQKPGVVPALLKRAGDDRGSESLCEEPFGGGARGASSEAARLGRAAAPAADHEGG